MKWKMMIVLLALLTGSQVFAGVNSTNAPKMKNAVTKLCMSLDNENNGVRNSALCLLAQMKIENPQLDMKNAEKKAARLAQKDNCPLVRFNASITHAILAEELPSEQINVKTRNPQEFFSHTYSSVSILQ